MREGGAVSTTSFLLFLLGVFAEPYCDISQLKATHVCFQGLGTHKAIFIHQLLIDWRPEVVLGRNNR